MTEGAAERFKRARAPHPAEELGSPYSRTVDVTPFVSARPSVRPSVRKIVIAQTVSFTRVRIYLYFRISRPVQREYVCVWICGYLIRKRRNKRTTSDRARRR